MGESKAGRKKIRPWHIIVIIIGIIAIGSLIAFFMDAGGRRELEAMTIGNVDFTNLQDGVYTGEYSGTKGHFRDATVEITITEGAIIDIRILKGAVDGNGKPTEITNGITVVNLYQSVIQSQSLQVDAISGATLTSKAHLKALENALKKAQKE